MKNKLKRNCDIRRNRREKLFENKSGQCFKNKKVLNEFNVIISLSKIKIETS